MDSFYYFSKSSAKQEKKRTYGSLLRFNFSQLLLFFSEFNEKFKALTDLRLDEFYRNMQDFQTNLLSELAAGAKNLAAEVQRAELCRQQLTAKKNDYFEFVHNMSIEHVYRFNGLRFRGDKDHLRLRQKEQQYFYQHYNLNKVYSKIKQQYQVLKENYRDNIK